MAHFIAIIALFFITKYGTTNASAVECVFQIMDLPPIGDEYTCEGRALIDDNENITAVYGVHQPGKGRLDVRGIQIRSQNLQFFPKNLDAFFPNLIAIYLSNNSISSVTNSHLNPFPNLQILTFHINSISTLDSNLFSGIKWTASNFYISFFRNNIRHIGHDISLPNVGSIDFRENPCIDYNGNSTDSISTLKLNLLRHCPPTIWQIEDTLESRPNLLTQLRSKNNRLERRVAFLEAVIENRLGIKIDDTEDVEVDAEI